MRWPKDATNYSNIRVGLRMTPLNQALMEAAEVDHTLPTQAEVKM